MAWDGDGADVELYWNFAWGTMGFEAHGAADREASLVWESECQGLLGVVAPPNSTIDLWPGYPSALPPPVIAGTSVARLLPLPGSPGDVPQKCTFRGQVTPKATNEASNWGAAGVMGIVSFRGQVALEAVPGEAEGRLRVTNLGNAAADLEFRVEGAPGWNATPVEPVVLGAPGAQGPPALSLRFHVTGPGGSLDGLDLVVTPRSVRDPRYVGEPARIPLADLVEAKAAKVQDAPGPVAGVLVALAACALAVARRRGA